MCKLALWSIYLLKGQREQLKSVVHNVDSRLFSAEVNLLVAVLQYSICLYGLVLNNREKLFLYFEHY
jgi:hypothetical protein